MEIEIGSRLQDVIIALSLVWGLVEVLIKLT